MKKLTVKWYHFVLAWATMLVVTCVLGMLFLGGLISITSIYAAISSAPFIVVFAFVMHQITKKEPQPYKVHLLALMWHILGSICVLVGLYVFKNSETLRLGSELIYLMLFYFAADSVLFHLAIWKFHKPNYSKLKPNRDELLDDIDIQ